MLWNGLISKQHILILEKKNDEQVLIKVWGRLGTSRRQYLLLKSHMVRVIEKSCELLGTQDTRVTGPPRTDKLAASRLSLALFKAYKCSLMARELAGHYSSVSEPDEWRIGNSSAMTFNSSLIITANKTVRVMGINSKAAYAPEKTLDTVMPVPEEFVLAELWFCKNWARIDIFAEIIYRIQTTVVYSNMAMVQRLCPELGLTPVNHHQTNVTGILRTENGALDLMQTTQWIYDRGMHELQEAAIESFHDIPVQVHKWEWSENSTFPVATCTVTYLKFPVPGSNKDSDRPLRENPVLVPYAKCVVMPYHESGQWRRVKPISIPHTISYRARRALDGELVVGDGEGQPEYKDCTERVQDLAEEETGEGDSAEQHPTVGPNRVSFSAFKSRFEPYGPGGMVMKRDVYDDLPIYTCPLCHSLHGDGGDQDTFRSLQQLSEHVMQAHDVVFYSTTTYSCQQVLLGRLIKAAHMWLNKENETFGKKSPFQKERKIKRHGKDAPSAPFLDTPYMPLDNRPTPVPPRLTAEPVNRGPLVRPEFPRASNERIELLERKLLERDHSPRNASQPLVEKVALIEKRLREAGLATEQSGQSELVREIQRLQLWVKSLNGGWSSNITPDKMDKSAPRIRKAM